MGEEAAAIHPPVNEPALNILDKSPQEALCLLGAGCGKHLLGLHVLEPWNEEWERHMDAGTQEAALMEFPGLCSGEMQILMAKSPPYTSWEVEHDLSEFQGCWRTLSVVGFTFRWFYEKQATGLNDP